LRIVRARTPWEDVPRGAAAAGELGLRVAFQVRLAADNPAQVMSDELDTANRVAETVLAGLANPGMDLALDTFDDIDRGYFSRDGLVDRRFNPRPAGLVYRHLHAALAGMRPALGERRASSEGVVCLFSAGAKRGALVLPRAAGVAASRLFE